MATATAPHSVAFALSRCIAPKSRAVTLRAIHVPTRSSSSRCTRPRKISSSEAATAAVNPRNPIAAVADPQPPIV